MAIGIVVATGRCAKTIRVRVPKLTWNSHIRKKYTDYTHHLVHDGAEACVEGDCVRILPRHVTSRRKTHIVAEIISPMRTGSERKPLESVEEWVAKKEAKRRDKVLRREMKRGVVGVSNIEGLWAAGKVVEDGTREDLRGYEGIVKEGEAGDEQVLG
ncbi:unnamed protein product [Tuber melanosporum]|jgi:ribosomal protein S17|uniref:(Perigord truffle) hypothetical protein n=1 Tax=Tuber melanosporum (strain Mel28) TaxID=656061 RepID=D5GCN4_TUBMM|nr:uncharacterized protein GSTUM_00000745001 [Tuber melanosporum]CAZ82277.1 unnamed protein product [Tuber melanosporum]